MKFALNVNDAIFNSKINIFFSNSVIKNESNRLINQSIKNINAFYKKCTFQTLLVGIVNQYNTNIHKLNVIFEKVYYELFCQE